MREYRIRGAEPEDVPAMLELYRPYVEGSVATFEYEVPSLEEFAGRVEHVTRQFPWLVCEAEGRVAGYAYASGFHTRQAYQWACELSVYVEMGEHRRGVGSALYCTLLRLLKRQGYYQAYAVITVPNEESQAFHQRFGFEQVGYLPQCGFKLGQWCGIEYQLLRLREPSVPAQAPLPVSAVPEEAFRRICGMAWNR